MHRRVSFAIDRVSSARLAYDIRRSEIAPIIETRCGAFGMEVPSTTRGRIDHRDLKAALNLE